MSVLNFIPEVWEARIERYQQRTSVFEGLVNTRYEGVIEGLNSKVKINTLGGVTLREYTKGSDITLEELDSAQTELTIDQAKYWAVFTHDVDKVQMNVNLIDEASADAGQKISMAKDEYVLGKYGAAGLTYGTTDAPIDILSTNIIQFFARMNRIFDDALLPENGRWIVVPNWFVEKMVLAKINISTSNDGTITNGRVAGNFMGWDIRRSSNISTVTTTKYKCLAGVTNYAISFVNALAETQAFRPEKRFEDAIKGLYVYGGDVIRPDYLCCATLTEGTEA